MTAAKGGRPTRAQAAAKAMALAQRFGVDTEATFDPLAILEAIACDPSAPASARVQAIKVWHGLQSDAPQESMDPISARAIALLAGNGRAN